MKAPMVDACYIGDVAHAARTSEKWIENLISRKMFEPSNRTVPGRARIFNEADAIRFATTCTLQERYYLPLEIATRVARHMKKWWPEISANIKSTEKPVYLVLSPVTNDWAIDYVIGAAERNAVLRERQDRDSWAFGAIVLNLTMLAVETSARLREHIENEMRIDEQLRQLGAADVYDNEEE